MTNNIKYIFITFFIMISSASIVVYAGVDNDIPSCYLANQLPLPKDIDEELFVLSDQTTHVDQNLKQLVMEVIDPHIHPGRAFVISKFSSYAQGRYIYITTAGVLERLLTKDERYDIRSKSLKTFDACMADQKKFGRDLVASSLNKILNNSSSDIAKSDVISSLKEVSDRVKKSTAKRRIVLIVSDMLENSSLTSFYANKTVRKITPEKEMSIAEDNGMLGDFGGAEVYVIGAGTLSADSESKNGIYRNPQVMKALSSFWELWFEKSNAKLIEFGQPALLNPIE